MTFFSRFRWSFALWFNSLLGNLGLKMLEWGTKLRSHKLSLYSGNVRVVWKGNSIWENRYVAELSHMLTSMSAITFNGRGSQVQHQTPLIKALLQVEGIKSIVIEPYECIFRVSAAYNWELEVKPKIERLLVKHLSGVPVVVSK